MSRPPVCRQCRWSRFDVFDIFAVGEPFSRRGLAKASTTSIRVHDKEIRNRPFFSYLYRLRFPPHARVSTVSTLAAVRHARPAASPEMSSVVVRHPSYRRLALATRRHADNERTYQPA